MLIKGKCLRDRKSYNKKIQEKVITLSDDKVLEYFKVGNIKAGPKASILDIKGVRISHFTMNQGKGKMETGKGPVRTGLTMVYPVSKNVWEHSPTCSVFVANGYGKTTGIPQIEELGVLETPIFLTNTMSVGDVWAGAAQYMLEKNHQLAEEGQTVNPVVGECNDGYLNDVYGRHIRPENVIEASKNLSSENTAGGNLGAGTGMVAFGFKGGLGHSSRKIEYNGYDFTLGCLVLANYGERKDLRINGIPVGHKLPPWEKEKKDGSIMIILGTDIPFDNRQLNRICRRAPLGLALTGSVLGHGSGDFVLAFSTTNISSRQGNLIYSSKKVREKGDFLNKVFQGVVEVVAAAVYDALLRAEPMVGRDNRRVEALPAEKIIDIIQGG